VKTVAFEAENRLKLANMMTSQRTKMATNGAGITLSDGTKTRRWPPRDLQPLDRDKHTA
jgi:hypothetical protein